MLPEITWQVTSAKRIRKKQDNEVRFGEAPNQIAAGSLQKIRAANASRVGFWP